MRLIKVVIDTNVFFAGLSYNSYYFPIIEAIYRNKLMLLVSTPILLEYKEILENEYPSEMMDHFFNFLDNSSNIGYVNPTFKFQLPFEDADDQMFVDCAVCGNADYLITNDRHFDVLHGVEFPKLKVITAENFIDKTGC